MRDAGREREERRTREGNDRVNDGEEPFFRTGPWIGSLFAEAICAPAERRVMTMETVRIDVR